MVCYLLHYLIALITAKWKVFRFSPVFAGKLVLRRLCEYHFYLIGQAVILLLISVVSNKLNTQLLANVYFYYHLPDETVTIAMVYLVKKTCKCYSDKLGDFHFYY